MADAKWYYAKDGKDKVGPISSRELRELVASGKLLATDLVWKEGMPEWTSAGRIKGLFDSGTVQDATGPAAYEPVAANSEVHAAPAFFAAWLRGYFVSLRAAVLCVIAVAALVPTIGPSLHSDLPSWKVLYEWVSVDSSDRFFHEDFSTVERGELPAGWTSGTLLVDTVSGNPDKSEDGNAPTAEADTFPTVNRDNVGKWLRSFKPRRRHQLHVDDVEFPSGDFSFEWVVRTASTKKGDWNCGSGYWSWYTMEIGTIKVVLYVTLADDDRISRWGKAQISINETKQPLPLGHAHDRQVTITLTRKNDVFNVFVNGEEFLLANIPGHKAAKSFSFVAETERCDDWNFGLVRVTGKRM